MGKVSDFFRVLYLIFIFAVLHFLNCRINYKVKHENVGKMRPSGLDRFDIEGLYLSVYKQL